MATGDLPTMVAGTYGGSTAYGLGNLGRASVPFQGMVQTGGWAGTQDGTGGLPWLGDIQDKPKHFDWTELKKAQRVQQILNPQEEQEVTTRLVQVFIVDPHEDVPLDSRMIYRGSQHLTDATDQELFYEIDIKNLLAEHNAKRVKFVNKKVKERTEYLEPVKIRELKMVVVTIASF